MSSDFNSPIFGGTREATEDERKLVVELVEAIPVCVFQELNRKIRTRGLMMTIDVKDERPGGPCH